MTIAIKFTKNSMMAGNQGKLKVNFSQKTGAKTGKIVLEKRFTQKHFSFCERYWCVKQNLTKKKN